MGTWKCAECKFATTKLTVKVKRGKNTRVEHICETCIKILRNQNKIIGEPR